MKATDFLVKEIEWHERQDPAEHAVGIEYAAGFIAGLKHSLKFVRGVPDWEMVCDQLIDALTVYGEVLDELPCDVEDLLDEDKLERVEAATQAYETACAAKTKFGVEKNSK